MKSKDQLLLEAAYNKVATSQNETLDEGVWSQLKGLGKGIVAGAKTGAQNLAAGAAKAIGVKVDDTGRQTMGQSYAKAQQGSMLKDFQTNAEKTVNDFINDAKKMGVDLNDPNIIKQFPEAAAAYKEVQNLLKYVKNPSAAPSSTPSSPATTPPTPTPTTTASTTATNSRTGGKVAGQMSQTPNAIRQRAARAAKKTTKSSSAAPVPAAVPATSSAPAAPTTSASKTAGFTQTSTGVTKKY